MRELKKILLKIKDIGISKTLSIAIKRIKYKQMLKAKTIQERFNIIYKENHWSSEESISGDQPKGSNSQLVRMCLFIRVCTLAI